MTIVDSPVVTAVTGGVDTHVDSHVAAALDQIGGLLGVESFDVSEAGYSSLLDWLGGFGTVVKVGVEGTGSYGAGLFRFLHRHGIEVVEVDRPDRQLRHREGKSDPTDAVAAARAALSGKATGRPKLGNGPVEQMRILTVARRSAREQRIQTLNQIRQLVFRAPEVIRERFIGRYQITMLKELAAIRSRPGVDPVAYVTLMTLRDLARRIGQLDAETKRISGQLKTLIDEMAPSLLDVHGLGADGAAVLLVAAGDNPARIRSEAAWAHLCGGRSHPRLLRQDHGVVRASDRAAGACVGAPPDTPRRAHDHKVKVPAMRPSGGRFAPTDSGHEIECPVSRFPRQVKVWC